MGLCRVQVTARLDMACGQAATPGSRHGTGRYVAA
jgi:hypothetical protein